MKETVAVTLRHPETGALWQARLPRGTFFDELPGRLIQEGFLRPQKGGYRFLIRGFLCSSRRTLGDYLPPDADTLEIQVFGMPIVI